MESSLNQQCGYRGIANRPRVRRAIDGLGVWLIQNAPVYERV